MNAEAAADDGEDVATPNEADGGAPNTELAVGGEANMLLGPAAAVFVELAAADAKKEEEGAPNGEELRRVGSKGLGATGGRPADGEAGLTAGKENGPNGDELAPVDLKGFSAARGPPCGADELAREKKEGATVERLVALADSVELLDEVGPVIVDCAIFASTTSICSFSRLGNWNQERVLERT